MQCFILLPLQDHPSPEYPGLHEQLYEPSALLHTASALQLCSSVAHSSISEYVCLYLVCYNAKGIYFHNTVLILNFRIQQFIWQQIQHAVFDCTTCADLAFPKNSINNAALLFWTAFTFCDIWVRYHWSSFKVSIASVLIDIVPIMRNRKLYLALNLACDITLCYLCRSIHPLKIQVHIHSHKILWYCCTQHQHCSSPLL